MPMAIKLKTHSWAAKRFKVTKKKKVFAEKACNNHLLTNKWKAHKNSPYGKQLEKTRSKKIKNLIPYK
jgi:ribosomal protein L35